MRKWITGICAVALAMMPMLLRADEVAAPAVPSAGHAKVVVIPIHGEIVKPQLYILRRGLKEAIDQHVDTVVLDLQTPGGALDVTFQMLEALEKFPGKKIAYVNREAISAGALIAAAADEIYFAPNGVIGAAAPVNEGGEDIKATMRAKIVSYLKARVRTIAAGKGHRGEVISAMIDLDSELSIDGVLIKPKNELLSLTAQEAMKSYGDPPVPLLGTGIAKDLDELLDQIHGSGRWSSTRLEVTWSENFAQYLTALTPLLMAAGLVCLFIEFKTPGFGIFGITGGAVLAVVFLSQYVAGLSGHEPAIFFVLGVLLILIELFFFPGTVAFAIVGVVLMMGSLVWSMADLWPSQPLVFSTDVFLKPIGTVALGLFLAMLIFGLLLKFLPRGSLWGNMVLHSVVGGYSGAPAAVETADSLIGKTGVAATALFPSGQVIIDGRRHEARLGMGSAEAGTPVVVVGRQNFSLEVEVIPS